MTTENRNLREPRTCHCLCGRWEHLGICQGEATQMMPFDAPATGLTHVPLCDACADDIHVKASA
jgi:hypothetical protein